MGPQVSVPDPRALWQKLGDIPIDEEENIEEVFEHFPIRTNKYDIWHWFEETFEIILGDWIYARKTVI
jgi:hypothetical protein